jgi:hypothetical protein
VLALGWDVSAEAVVLLAAAAGALAYLWRKVLLPAARLVTWFDRYGLRVMERLEAEMTTNGGESVKDRVDQIAENTEMKTEMAEANAKRLERMDGRQSVMNTRLGRLERSVKEHIDAHG